MCSMYWNLKAEITCPHCHETYEAELQTHFRGEAGSCVNFYRIGEPIEELGESSGSLPSRDDDALLEICKCGAFINFGFDWRDGAITRLHEPILEVPA